MKTTLLILLFFSLYNSRYSFAQYPIFMPTSESSVLWMNPGLIGMEFKSRVAVNQLYQSHPMGDLHSLNATYDLDIPKLNMVTGLQLAGDRIGTKNQNLMFRWNLGYVYNMTDKARLIYTFHTAFANQSFDGQTYFNRFDYNDILLTNAQGTSHQKYFTQSLGFALHTPFVYGGINSTINSSYLGQFNGINLFTKLVTNVYLGLNLKTKVGTFKPFYSYLNHYSWAGNEYLLIDKFPSISNHNMILNYQYKKWTSGIGMRTIKNHPNMYHVQVGIDLNKVKLGYSVGVIPYKNSSHESHVGVLSQVSLELNLKRSKYYHLPVFHTEIDEFPDHTTKIEHYYKDDELLYSIEYFDNGLEKSTTYYENGLLNGPYSEYNENGILIIDGHYRKGLKNGAWSYYNAEENRIKYEKYYMGDLIKTVTYENEN
jgi:hypothetical protein